MKFAVMLDTGKVYRLIRPRASVRDALASGRAVVIDTTSMKYWDPNSERDDTTRPILSDGALTGESSPEEEA